MVTINQKQKVSELSALFLGYFQLEVGKFDSVSN